MLKVLLTGSTGMVGRNILEHPAAREIEWLCPSRRECDLRDYGSVVEYMRKHRPDFVVQAAGRVGGIQANIRYPVEFLVENIDLGRNVVMAAKACGIPRLLNLASSCIYPRDRLVPLRENDILSGELEPTNEGYALAKIVTLRLCQYVSRTTPGLAYKTVIPCNLYGRWDKFDPESSHLVAAVIRKLHEAKRSGVREVTIWGDGQARREFMYAGDFADFIITAINAFDLLPDVLNVGKGEDKTIDEYYRTIASVIGYDGSFVYDLNQPVGMRRKLLDSSRLMSLLGWQARTDLMEGVRKTYEFFLEIEK